MSWNLTSIFKLTLSLHGVLATALSQIMTIFLGFYIKLDSQKLTNIHLCFPVANIPWRFYVFPCFGSIFFFVFSQISGHSKLKDCRLRLLLYMYRYIQANGRGGRETNLCIEKINLFFFEPIYRNDLSKVVYKIQQIKLFEEVTGLYVSIIWEKWSESVSRCNF